MVTGKDLSSEKFLEILEDPPPLSPKGWWEWEDSIPSVLFSQAAVRAQLSFATITKERMPRKEYSLI